jgi:Sugar-transfer associated ATP-grasp
MSVLETSKGTSPFDARWAAAEVVRRAGKSVIRQGLEMTRTRFGPGKMDAPGYYGMGLWRREFDWPERFAYVSAQASKAINLALSPPGPRLMRTLFDDKVLTGVLLKAAGFQVPEILASCGATHFPGVRHLSGLDETATFLERVELPVFAKPIGGSRNVGSFSMLAREGGEILMGSGKRADVLDAARAISEGFREGYIFQRFIAAHPLIAQFSARALPTLRVVTLLSGGEAEVAYAILRLPGENTNVDDFASKGAAYCLLDPVSGKIDVARSGNYLRGREVQEHPASGMSLEGFAVPFWSDVRAACADIHLMFQGHGCIGFDVAITPQGPLIVELNYNPQHVLYQLSSDRPFRSGAVWNKVQAVMAERAKASASRRSARRP